MIIGQDLTNPLPLVCCPVAFYIISFLNFRHPKHYWIMSSFDMGIWEQIYFFSSQRKIYILWRRHMGTKPSMWLFFFIFASVQCSQHIAKLHCFAYTNRKEVFSKGAYSFYVAGSSMANLLAPQVKTDWCLSHAGSLRSRRFLHLLLPKVLASSDMLKRT